MGLRRSTRRAATATKATYKNLDTDSETDESVVPSPPKTKKRKTTRGSSPKANKTKKTKSITFAELPPKTSKTVDSPLSTASSKSTDFPVEDWRVSCVKDY